jgi:hypothetical protein
MEKRDLNIFRAVKSDQIKEITKDLSEAAIDQFLKDGLLRDIPIVGTFYNIYNLSQNISNSFFTKKMLKFLLELNTIPKLERINFIERLESEDESRKVGEKILIIINKIDDTDKATILGKLFKITIEEEIEITTFMRLCHMIDKVYLEDLYSLKDTEYLDNLDSEIKYNLSQVGILNQSIKDNRDHEEYVFKNTGRREYYPPKFEYKISSYGYIIIKHGL